VISDLQRRAGAIAALVAALWLVAGADLVVFDGTLRRYGIEPRSVQGLRGIAFSPFLHTGVAHLACNSAALALFGGLVMLRSERHFWSVTALGALVGGAATWLLARPALHVGASGLVFAYFGYLLFTGIFERRLAPLLLSSAVFALWGGLLFGILPLQGGVSWEGHLFGLAAGALAARLLAGRRA
jgi:membrane associated rhomboid family serine protease